MSYKPKTQLCPSALQIPTSEILSEVIRLGWVPHRSLLTSKTSMYVVVRHKSGKEVTLRFSDHVVSKYGRKRGKTLTIPYGQRDKALAAITKLNYI